MSQELDFMGDFNPSDLSVFKTPEKKEGNQNIYKTNPKDSKAEDGHYRSKIRILYNPFDIENSVVRSVKYALTDSNGFFMVDSSLSVGDKSCPIFKAWKQLWFNKTTDNKEFCKSVFKQSDLMYVLVQILEDDNQPDMVGQLKIWKLPKKVWVKMDAMMNPSPESKKQPVKLMDWLFGRPLEIDVTPGPDDPKHPERKQREITYDLCEFISDYEPIIRVDGTPLFDDNELEILSAYDEAKTKLQKAKTEADKKKRMDEAKALVPQVKELYTKAESYLKENAIDVVEEVGYKPWNDATKERVQNWINIVLTGVDPSTVSDNPLLNTTTSKEQIAAVKANTPPMNESNEDDDLPF